MFLTYAALSPMEGYSPDEFQNAIEALPQEGLREVADALVQALEGTDEQREDYWTNQVYKFWKGIWPKSRELISNDIVESLARLCIAARGEFPIAFEAVQELAPTN